MIQNEESEVSVQQGQINDLRIIDIKIYDKETKNLILKLDKADITEGWFSTLFFLTSLKNFDIMLV